MSSNSKRVKKRVKNFLVNREQFLAGLQGLTAFTQEKTDVYIQIRDRLGESDPAVENLKSELETLEVLINFFSELVRDQNTGENNYFN